MKKTLLFGFVFGLLIFFFPVHIMAQEIEGTQAEKIGVDSAQQKLVEISVTKFEDVAFWKSSMPLDQGLNRIRRFKGSPLGKEPIAGEEASNVRETDDYVLGAKIAFFRRGKNTFAVYPVRPIHIEGITKTLSVWVVGRNFNHTLKVVIADYYGMKRELTIGKLNFMGWKKLTVAIPPSISQDEFHFSSQRGIKFIGFKVDFDIMESYGTYYIYFDDLRAVTDLFAEEYRDRDDMTDGW